MEITVKRQPITLTFSPKHSEAFQIDISIEDAVQLISGLNDALNNSYDKPDYRL